MHHSAGQLRWKWAVSYVVFGMVAALLMFSITGATEHATPEGPHAAETPAGNAENGKRLYLRDGCDVCHSYQGQGTRYRGSRGGPRIGPDSLPFPAFSAYVRKPAGSMPPYSERVLSEHELADIYAFLQSLPHPPPVKTIRLLN